MFIELGYFECISSARSRSTEFCCCQVPKINYLQFYIAVLKLDHKSAAKTLVINWETLLRKKNLLPRKQKRFPTHTSFAFTSFIVSCAYTQEWFT